MFRSVATIRSFSTTLSTMASPVIRQIISTKNAPAALGPYSQAVRIGDTLYISGSLGLDPANGNFVAADTEAQAHQALKNIGAVLNEAGANFSNVVKTTILLADMNDFVTVNSVYAQYFSQPYPARAAYQVARLPKDGRIEIEAVAHIGPITEKSA